MAYRFGWSDVSSPVLKITYVCSEVLKMFDFT